MSSFSARDDSERAISPCSSLSSTWRLQSWAGGLGSARTWRCPRAGPAALVLGLELEPGAGQGPQPRGWSRERGRARGWGWSRERGRTRSPGRAPSPGAVTWGLPACGSPAPALPVCPPVGLGEGTHQDRPRGAQQGQHGLVLVPVLGFLCSSSICISLITLLFGHLGLIPVIVLGFTVCLTGFCECSAKGALKCCFLVYLCLHLLSSEGWGNFLHCPSVITHFELRWSLACSEALFIPVPAAPLQRVLHKPRTSLFLFPEQGTKFSFYRKLQLWRVKRPYPRSHTSKSSRAQWLLGCDLVPCVCKFGMLLAAWTHPDI